MSSTDAYDLDRPYREADPLDMADAREASRRVSRMRRDAEQLHRRSVSERAEAERSYRELRATAMLRLRVPKEGEKAPPATLLRELADGESEVAAALERLRIAEGMVDAWRERLRSIEGERSMLKSLIDWSSSIANVLRQAGGMRDDPEQAGERPIGARR